MKDRVRKIQVLIVFALLSLPLFGWQKTSLPEILKDNPALIGLSDSALEAFTSEIRPAGSGNDRTLLRKIFRQVHRQFLKKYKAYSEFQDIFLDGNYDCLTATTLFSLILDKYNFNYSLIETNYHIFLIVHTRHGDVLLETTDKSNGFVTDAREISQRTCRYRQNELAVAKGTGEKVYFYHLTLYHELSPSQLPGLLYFNQAIRMFNVKDWERSADLISKASRIYDTPRIDELVALLLKTVDETVQNEATKKKITSLLHQYLTAKTVARL